MPIFKYYTVVELVRGVKAFLRLDLGLTRGELPNLEQPDRELARKNQEIARLREMLTVGITRERDGGIKPENIIWIFGTRRTGSTWLSSMMGDLRNHTVWPKPYVGEIFGTAYYTRAWDWQRKRAPFILGNRYKAIWLESIRDIVLDGAHVRFPEVAEQGFLIIKEPNGSIGAPLLTEAFPESRMVFLVRDPRDIVASDLDAHKKGSWMPVLIYNVESAEDTLADKNPDAFVKERAEFCLANLESAKQAYEAHKGHKVLVRYEDLRADTLGTMKRIYSSLEVPVDEGELIGVIEERSWENISDSQKGAGKPYRKATPGGWQEDLTPEQVEIVEQIAAPILEEFYSDAETRVHRNRA
jgi:hypothetical protein